LGHLLDLGLGIAFFGDQKVGNLEPYVGLAHEALEGLQSGLKAGRTSQIIARRAGQNVVEGLL